jgi:hypothetical protein
MMQLASCAAVFPQKTVLVTTITVAASISL